METISMKKMKFKMKALTVGALALAGATLSHAQTADLPISTFDTGTQGSQPNGCGAWYGSYTAGWDGTVNAPSGSGGSLYIQSIFSNGSDTPLTEYICLPGNNLWWSGNGTFLTSTYKSLDFDIKWDNSSVLTIPQFNDPSTVPTSLLQGWAPYGYLAGSIGGLEVDLAWKGDGSTTTLITTNIPTAASNGWVHISIPINPSQANIDPAVGILFKKWLNQNWGLADATTATANFWVDNVVLIGTAGPPPPPTVSAPVKPTPGLNCFASTKGNSFYDRQDVVLRQSTGLSWVGQATPGNPVSYSFTISGYPNSVNCEAYMFLVPNPAFVENAPDWNETNCAVFFLQGNNSSAIGHFQYKVNENSQNAMYGGGTEARGSYTNAPGSWNGVTPNYLESGDLGSVTNTGVLGTWTVRFTSDTNITLIAPNGSTSSLVLPAYNKGYFAESSGFNVYIGMQANNADAMNQAVVFSNIAITGTASPYSENFLAQSVLDTTNVWNNSIAGGPNGVLIVPQNTSAYWLRWTLPDANFNLQVTSNLLGGASSWNTVAAHSPIALDGLRQQLVDASEVPAGRQAFFNLIKRQFTQLQVLFPGENNAPNTVSGKSGTPSPINAGDTISMTINAVDSTFHIVSGATDQIHLTTTDGSAIVGLDSALNNGSTQILVQLNTQGAQTITATDMTNTNIPTATSSSVNVQ